MDLTAIIQSIQEQFPGALVEQTPGWIVIRKEALTGMFGALKNGPAEFLSLHCLTAVDRKENIEVVYHLYSFKCRIMLTVKVILPVSDLTVDSLTPLWGGASWLEREVFDLFGVRFLNHPDLRRILNPDSWTGHPLRKDFQMAGVIPKPAG